MTQAGKITRKKGGGRNRKIGFRDETGALLFYIAFFMMVLGRWIETLKTDSIGTLDAYRLYCIIFMTAPLLIALKIFLFQKMTVPQMVISFCLLFAGLVTWKMSGDERLFTMLLFALGGSGAEVRKLAGISVSVRLPGVILAAILSQTGVIEDYIILRGNYIRHALGFTHPNIWGHYLFCICLALCVLRFGKKPWFEAAAAIVCAFLCLFVADSRTSFLMLLILAVFFLLYYLLKKRLDLRVMVWFSGFVAVCAVGLSLLFMVIYSDSNPVLVYLNKLFSNRFSLANSYFEAFGVSLFGHNYVDVYLNEIEGILVDNSFAYLILVWGILGLLLLILLMAVFFAGGRKALLNQTAQEEYSRNLFGMCMYFIYGISEGMFLRVEFNYFFVAVSDVFYGYRKRTDAAERTPLGWVRCVLHIA